MTWARVRGEFEALLAMPEPERAGRLAVLATTERWLHDELQELLRHDAAAGAFLERDAPRPAAPAAGQAFGRFTLVRPLGVGGMGAVWEARQTDPERHVALKLFTAAPGGAAESWRFAQEIRVLAALQHPAIAMFFDAGTERLAGAEVQWLAMELVSDAQDLLTWAERARATLAHRLDLFDALADAVEHGHRCGVLHRDLKPANVLIDGLGRLKLIDFGIARALAADAASPGVTRTGAVVGTLQYLAPECLGERAAPPAVAVDVWSLGVILYELLCGRPPFGNDGASMAGTIDAVLRAEPVPPRRLRPELPYDLQCVILHALAKDPARRYPTVAALRADLQRVRMHRPITARAPGVGYRCSRFVRRHRVAAVIAGALLAGVVAGGVGLVTGYREARAGEEAALRGLARSRQAAAVTASLFDAIQDRADSRDLRVHELLDAAPVDPAVVAEPAVEAVLREVLGMAHARLRRFAEARRELERAAVLHGRLRTTELTAVEQADLADRAGEVMAVLAWCRMQLGERQEGRAALQAALAAANELSPRGRIAVLRHGCMALTDASAHADVVPLATELASVAGAAGDVRSTIRALRWQARALSALDRGAEAREQSASALALARSIFGDAHEEVCDCLADHVTILQQAGAIDEALASTDELLAAVRRVYGEEHSQVAITLNNRAHLELARRQGGRAIAILREVVALYDRRGQPTTRDHLAAVGNLGQLLNMASRFIEAEPLLARAAAATRNVLAADDPDGIHIRINHAACLAWQRRWTEAEPVLLAEYETLARVLPADHGDLAKVRRTIAGGYEVNGFPEQAQAWRAR
ncbi:MAG: serine/threonine protein kinase [Planctomycetes bacterium]|nr:serine/threonine protein kinase [Planctomycetota bacterium]